MMKSMTGFGRCEVLEAGRKVTAELKSVNHKYLELGVKLPRRFQQFEGKLRALLKTYAQRGKVDLFLCCEEEAQKQANLRYNKEIAMEYLKYMGQMVRDFDIANDIAVTKLALFPEVFTMEEQEVEEERTWALLEQAVRGAAEAFLRSREEEGEKLKEDITDKLHTLSGLVGQIEAQGEARVLQYRQKLRERLEEVLGNIKVDENRIAAEVVLYADRICVDEEIVRLSSHIRQMEETLQAGGSVGRKLDFIAQEMNREANTILSKSGNLEVTNAAIEMKTEIEKIREQIQNIE